MLERRRGPGEETSFANGVLHTPSMSPRSKTSRASAGAGSRGCRGHTARDRCRRGVAMNAACGRLQMRRSVPARQLAAHDA